MKRRRFMYEEIIGILKQHEAGIPLRTCVDFT